MFSVESLILTARYCQGMKTSLNFSGIYLLYPELSLESEVIGSSQCREDAVRACLLGGCCGSLQSQGLSLGVRDCERHSGGELEGRNQVGIKDLEPHLTEGSSGRDVDTLSRVWGSLYPSKLSLSPDIQ